MIDARDEPIWWALIGAHGPMVGKWSDTRESFIEANRLTRNFRLLYGPVTRSEAEEFIEDIYPPKRSPTSDDY